MPGDAAGILLVAENPGSGSEAVDEVLARARSGDRDAFNILIMRHEQRILRLAQRMLGSREDAMDAAQETFLRVFRHLHTFDLKRDFSAWLYRIAVNGSIDLLRKRKRHDAHLEPLDSDEPSAPVLSLASSSPTADRLVYSAQLGKRVAGVLEQLSSVERAAFILRHYEELSTEEIAESLGLSSNAAKQAVFRAVQKMRKALEAWTRSRQ